MSLER